MSKFLAWCRNPNKRKRTATSLHGQIYHWACLLRDDGVSHPRAYRIIRKMVDAVREENARFTPDREILSAIQYAYEVTPSTGTERVRPWPVPNRTLQAECKRLSARLDTQGSLPNTSSAALRPSAQQCQSTSGRNTYISEQRTNTNEQRAKQTRGEAKLLHRHVEA